MGTFGNTFGLVNSGQLMSGVPRADLIVGRWNNEVLNIEGLYYLKALVGANLLITNFDFPDLSHGFPYKSAATISVGGYTDLPVVSLFQDMDYNHIMFTKHIAATFDANGVEITPSYISEIVVYSQVLTGDDLIAANTYFSVPAEDTYWLNLTSGNDANNATTRALAKKKFGTGIETGLTSGIVNVLSGNDISAYTPVKPFEMNGKGYAICRGCASANSDAVRIWRNIVFDGGGVSTYGFTVGTGAVFSNITLYRCLFRNLAEASTLFGKQGTMTSDNLKWDSVVINQSIFVRGAYCGLVEIKNSLLKGSPSGYYIQSLKYISIKNNKVDSSILGASFLFTCLLGGSVIGNTIINNSSGSILFVVNATENQTKFNYNIVRQGDITYTVGKYIHLKGVNSEANYNDILLTGTSTSGTDNSAPIIYIFGATTPSAIGNLINFTASTIQRAIELLSNQVVCGACKINGNRILVKTAINCMVISLDGEKTSAEHHKFDGFEINNNVIYAPGYYNNGYGSMHAIMIHGNNGEARGNYVNGALSAILVKAVGTTVTCLVDGNKAINCANGFVVKGVNGVEVSNNIYDTNYSLGLASGVVIQMNGAEVAHNTYFHHNTIINRSTDNDSRCIWVVDDDCLTGLVSDYNTFYCYNSVFAKIGTNHYTFEQWQALGYDLHSTLLTEAPALDDSEL